jgi:hypothetical protein
MSVDIGVFIFRKSPITLLVKTGLPSDFSGCLFACECDFITEPGYLWPFECITDGKHIRRKSLRSVRPTSYLSHARITLSNGTFTLEDVSAGNAANITDC